MYRKIEDGFESRLFENNEDAGAGWVDTPAKISIDAPDDSDLDIDKLKAEAQELGIKVHHKAKAESIAIKIAEFKGE